MKDVVTLIFVVVYRCGWGGGGGNNVVWKMLKMLLRWRCHYVEVVEDVTTLKMLKMLLHIEDVITLKMLLRWRCRTEQRLQNGAVDLRLKKKDAHFVHGYLEDNAFFTWSIKELKLYQHAILRVCTKSTLDDEHDKEENLCFPRQQNPTMLATKWIHSVYYNFHEHHKTL